jgi:hypothetical protein
MSEWTGRELTEVAEELGFNTREELGNIRELEVKLGALGAKWEMRPESCGGRQSAHAGHDSDHGSDHHSDNHHSDNVDRLGGGKSKHINWLSMRRRQKPQRRARNLGQGSKMKQAIIGSMPRIYNNIQNDIIPGRLLGGLMVQEEEQKREDQEMQYQQMEDVAQPSQYLNRYEQAQLKARNHRNDDVKNNDREGLVSGLTVNPYQYRFIQPDLLKSRNQRNDVNDDLILQDTNRLIVSDSDSEGFEGNLGLSSRPSRPPAPPQQNRDSETFGHDDVQQDMLQDMLQDTLQDMEQRDKQAIQRLLSEDIDENIANLIDENIANLIDENIANLEPSVNYQGLRGLNRKCDQDVAEQEVAKQNVAKRIRDEKQLRDEAGSNPRGQIPPPEARIPRRELARLFRIPPGPMGDQFEEQIQPRGQPRNPFGNQFVDQIQPRGQPRNQIDNLFVDQIQPRGQPQNPFGNQFADQIQPRGQPRNQIDNLFGEQIQPRGQPQNPFGDQFAAGLDQALWGDLRKPLQQRPSGPNPPVFPRASEAPNTIDSNTALDQIQPRGQTRNQFGDAFGADDQIQPPQARNPFGNHFAEQIQPGQPRNLFGDQFAEQMIIQPRQPWNQFGNQFGMRAVQPDTNSVDMNSDNSVGRILANPSPTPGPISVDPIPIQRDTNSVDMKSVDMKSVDMKSVDMKSVDMKSVDMKSVDVNSVDMKSVDVNSVDMKSVDMNSVDVNSVDSFQSFEMENPQSRFHEEHPGEIKPLPSGNQMNQIMNQIGEVQENEHQIDE